MKKILLLSLLSTFVFAGSSDLELRLQELEMQVKALQFNVSNNEQDLEEYIPLIEKVETKSILDVLNFTPELELRMDKMNYKVGEIGGNENTLVYDGNTPTTEYRRKDFSKSFEPALTFKFNLNMDAKIDKKVSFHGRMLFVHSSQSNERLCILSSSVKSSASTTGMEFDRAYVDYTPNIGSDYEFTFSFGILPTTGGTPMNFAQDSVRKSMFPALVFDMNSYGLIGTQKLGDDTFVRLILAKGYTLNPNMFPYQCNRENIDNANIAGLYFDTKLGFLGDSMLSFGVNYLGDFKAHPYLGPDVPTNNSNVLGDMITFGLGIDAPNIADSGLTLFAHTALSSPQGNGSSDNYQIETNSTTGLQINPNDPLFSIADYAEGEMVSETGYSFYIGTKYDINENFNIGAEYNYGSKYWFSATQGAEDMYNKLAIRGDVLEVYSTWGFYKSMNFKLGYMHTNENYTGSGWHFGEPVSKDGMQDVVYLSLKAEF